MIYDIAPSVFINKTQYQYTDFFNLPIFAPPAGIFIFISLTDQYVDTSIHVDSETGTVRYRKKIMKTSI